MISSQFIVGKYRLKFLEIFYVEKRQKHAIKSTNVRVTTMINFLFQVHL